MVGVAVGTYVYPVAAMSFGQALTLSSFSTMVGQDCHLLRQGVRQTLTLPSFSTMVGQDCHLLRQGIHTLWCVSLSSGSNEFWAGIDLAGILHYG